MTRKEIAELYRPQLEAYGEIFTPEYGTLSIKDLEEPKEEIQEGKGGK